MCRARQGRDEAVEDLPSALGGLGFPRCSGHFFSYSGGDERGKVDVAVPLREEPRLSAAEQPKESSPR